MSSTKTTKGQLWTGSAVVPASAMPIGAIPAASGNTWGFSYEPERCALFAIGADGEAVDATGSAVSFDDAFEVRIFSALWDLRWRRMGHKARLAIVSDDDAFAGEWNRIKPAPMQELVPQDVEWVDDRYLVWGKKVESRDRWTRMTSRRIGSLSVPFPLEEGANRMAVTCRQYFKVDTEHFSNFVFVGERLTGFEGVR